MVPNVGAVKYAVVISADATWTTANSPYNYDAPVNVEAGAQLTIEPGVTVQCPYIQVDGTLRAIGTSADPISLRDVRFSKTSISWDESTGTGCIIQNSHVVIVTTYGAAPKLTQNTLEEVSINGDGSDGAHCIISDNNLNVIGIYGGSPVISDNIITRRNEGLSSDILITITTGSPIISNNQLIGKSYYEEPSSSFYGATEGYRVAYDGIKLRGGGATISDNVITDCANAICQEWGGDQAKTIIKNNLIFNNTANGIQLCSECEITGNTISHNNYAIKLLYMNSASISHNNILNCASGTSICLEGSPNDIDIPNNWWGTTDLSAINQSIYDSKYDYNLGTVNFEPILTASNSDAPAIPQTIDTPTATPVFTQPPLQSATPTQNPTQEPSITANPNENQSSSLTNSGNVIIGLLLGIIVILAICLAFSLKKWRH
jgi:hypothetical protein